MDDPIYFGQGRLPRPRMKKVGWRERRRFKRELKKQFPKNWKLLWNLHGRGPGGVGPTRPR